MSQAGQSYGFVSPSRVWTNITRPRAAFPLCARKMWVFRYLASINCWGQILHMCINLWCLKQAMSLKFLSQSGHLYGLYVTESINCFRFLPLSSVWETHLDESIQSAWVYPCGHCTQNVKDLSVGIYLPGRKDWPIRAFVHPFVCSQCLYR